MCICYIALDFNQVSFLRMISKSEEALTTNRVLYGLLFIATKQRYKVKV